MKNIFSSKVTKIGFLTIGSAALLLAALIIVNTLVGLIPENLTIADASENQMYSVSDAAKRDIAKVKDNVRVFLLSAGGESSLNETGIHLNTFLKRAAAQSKKISYNVIDLYSNTEFLEARGLDTSSISALSVLVESDLRYRYIDNTDIFYYYIDGIGKVTQSEAQMYQYYGAMYGTPIEVSQKFDGEAQLIKGLSYVTSRSLPQVVALTGHGETALTDTIKKQLTAVGTSFSEVASITDIPSCEMLIINAPTSDISASETAYIGNYLKKGGKIMLTTAAGITALPNLASLLDDYGLYYTDGVIIDPTQGSYYTYPNWLTPASAPHAATAEFNSSVLLPSAHAISIEETAGVSVTSILNTSAASYVIPVESTSAEKPDGAISASFPVGVIAEATNGSSVIWFSSAALFDDSANQYAGGGNYGYASSITAYACNTNTTADSEYKPLTLITERLTISGVSRVTIAILTVIVIPLIVLIIGAVYCHKRKLR